MNILPDPRNTVAGAFRRITTGYRWLIQPCPVGGLFAFLTADARGGEGPQATPEATVWDGPPTHGHAGAEVAPPVDGARRPSSRCRDRHLWASGPPP
ncbi:hypothetical protein FMEAI12_2590012 [Parafrankia sp. Ea1.12]|nr:hypothetical protein FMEAI12_2590012 [Parafrankia sp. Ea1.12]